MKLNLKKTAVVLLMAITTDGLSTTIIEPFKISSLSLIFQGFQGLSISAFPLATITWIILAIIMVYLALGKRHGNKSWR
jgi:hypothetical protein